MLMMMEHAGSAVSSSHIRDDTGVEFSETVCSVDFNSDEFTTPSHDVANTSPCPSQTSSADHDGISYETVGYDEGIAALNHFDHRSTLRF